MSCYIIKLRYIPDTSNDEFVNFGVIVKSNQSQEIKVRLTNNWDRIERISGDDISFIKEHAKQIENDINDKSADLGYMSTWIGCIRLSPESFILLDIDKALEFASKRYIGWID